jgi:hypothetical protein
MEPAERKKRVLIAVVGAVVALGFLGDFFWPVLKEFQHAQNGGQKSKALFGGFFLFMALAVVLSVALGLRKAFQESSAVLPQREPQPWLKRADWAAGRIKSTATIPIKIMVIFALAFGGFGGLMTVLVLPKELHNGNHLALVILLFPAVGIGFLIALIRRWQAQRRFGDCFFELAQIPAPLGGTLEGQITVGTRLKLEQGLHLKISCIRRTVSGADENRNTQETVLWQDEKVFRPEAGLPEPEPGRSGIPVYFKLPANQPECYAHGNEAILWRLEAKAKMSGPNFSALFEVPVFQVAGAVAAETEAEEIDPTASLQESVEELRRDENSKITVTDSAAGREFYFPAARNPGTAAGLTVFFAVWSGFVWLMLEKSAPVMFPIIFGLVDVFIFFGLVNLWFKSVRVTASRDGVTAVSRWLLFSRTRRFAAGDIAEIITQPGMQSGSQIYWAIKLVTRAANDSFAANKEKYQRTGELPSVKMQIREAGRGTALASGIASKPEADWLAREMTKALGR